MTGNLASLLCFGVSRHALFPTDTLCPQVLCAQLQHSFRKRASVSTDQDHTKVYIKYSSIDSVGGHTVGARGALPALQGKIGHRPCNRVRKICDGTRTLRELLVPHATSAQYQSVALRWRDASRSVEPTRAGSVARSNRPSAVQCSRFCLRSYCSSHK